MSTFRMTPCPVLGKPNIFRAVYSRRISISSGAQEILREYAQDDAQSTAGFKASLLNNTMSYGRFRKGSMAIFPCGEIRIVIAPLVWVR